MEEIKTEGICIKSIDYLESDKLLTLYAVGIGKVFCRAKGVRKAKAKLKFAAMPLTVADYILICVKGRFLISGADILTSHKNLWNNIEAYYAAVFMLELLDKFAVEGDIVDELYRTVTDCLNELETNHAVKTLNKYTAEFLRYAGFDVWNNGGLSLSGGLFYDPREIGFNNAGRGAECTPFVYESVLAAVDFCDNQTDAIGCFKLLLYHLHSVADIELKSEIELLSVLDGNQA